MNRDKALPGTRQHGRGDESLVSLTPDSLDALRDALDRKLGRTGAVLPLSEAEQRVLLELMPDEVLRVTLEDDETVLVVGRQRRVRVSTGPDAGPGQNACGGQPGDPVAVLYRAVGDCGRELLADFLATGANVRPERSWLEEDDRHRSSKRGRGLSATGDAGTSQ